MAVTLQQERAFVTALQDYVDTAKKANRFVKLSDERIQLIGQISIVISRKLGISVSSAKSYIDFKTGKFRDAGYMPYCTDPKLIELFKRLETITKELNTIPWETKTEAMRAVAVRQQKIQAMADEIKKQPGGLAVIEKAKKQVN